MLLVYFPQDFSHQMDLANGRSRIQKQKEELLNRGLKNDSSWFLYSFIYSLLSQYAFPYFVSHVIFGRIKPAIGPL